MNRTNIDLNGLINHSETQLICSFRSNSIETTAIEPMFLSGLLVGDNRGSKYGLVIILGGAMGGVRIEDAWAQITENTPKNAYCKDL